MSQYGGFGGSSFRAFGSSPAAFGSGGSISGGNSGSFARAFYGDPGRPANRNAMYGRVTPPWLDRYRRRRGLTPGALRMTQAQSDVPVMLGGNVAGRFGIPGFPGGGPSAFM